MAGTTAKAEKLSLEAVKKVSQLARLKLTDEELISIQNQLSLVLENFEQIAQVETTGVRPLVTPTEVAQVLRPDTVESFDSEKILVNAPEKAGRLFKVPPVV
jgi:aspartyl-tRNA(Asn)/glutamyl-tRNA(Gln) amidotransferase subunit C